MHLWKENNLMSSFPQPMIVILYETGQTPPSIPEYGLHLPFHKAQNISGSRSIIL